MEAGRLLQTAREHRFYICDKKGVTGTVTTSYAIVKVRIASNGMVAVILDNDDNTWINFIIRMAVWSRKI